MHFGSLTMSTAAAGTAPLRIAIVGAGIGGLTCAIACRRARPPFQVTVLERAPEILAVGAGMYHRPKDVFISTH
jgi:salicylate hydroxylase